MKCKMKNRAKSLSMLNQSRSEKNINENENYINIVNQDLTKTTLDNNPYNLQDSDVQKFLFQNMSSISLKQEIATPK